MSDRFKVDLGGMVDLLSHHLYSGPQVYIRELIQNAVDAVTARQVYESELAGAAPHPASPAQIRLRPVPGDGDTAVLEISDTGIGLTAEEATELLATIGRSSKRDSDFGLGRSEFLGQFGIGLLAAFMVADRIEVVSRSVRPGTAPIRWVGHADGTFEITQLSGSEATLLSPGTTVRLTARRDSAHWLSVETVVGLAAEYGSLLPFDLAVEVPVEGSAPIWRRITEPELPWRIEYDSLGARKQALSEYCENTFGFTPLGFIDLELPVAGVSGVAFILPQAVSPGSGQHRVYMKRMLLGARIDKILPDWAFFTRTVIDSDTLSPTASREQLHEDEVLLGVREALADQLKQWATRTLREPTSFARSFIRTHHLALRALALTDADMLDLVASILPFETTDGPLTLADAAKQGDEIVYTTTTEAYRRVATVARAQGLVVVNAGYVYDSDIMQALASRRGWRVRELASSDLVQVLGVPSLARELEVAPAVAQARQVLEEDDCDVIVRTFSPSTLPAILLRDAEGEYQRDLSREREASPGLWNGLLDTFATEESRRTRTLVLNDEAEVTRLLLSAPEGDVFEAGLHSLYLSAIMLAGEGLRSRESAALGNALTVLLEASLRPPSESPSESL